MCECFHEYLYGGTFDVFTDNNPLTYVLTTVKLDATTQCWVASLANYNFKTFYKSGKKNVEADALSRIEWNKMEAIAALARGCTTESSLPLPPQAVVGKTQMVRHLEPKLSSVDGRKEQFNDPDIGPVLQLVEKKEHLQYKLTNENSQGTRTLLKYRKDLVVKNGLLYKKV